MRNLLVAIAALAVFVALCSGQPATASASGCGTGGTATKTGANDYEIQFCGAALATLRIGNKTHIFRDGSCFDADGKGILMYVGTEVIHNGEMANVVDGHGPFLMLGLSTTFSGLAAYDGPHPLLAGTGAGGLTQAKASSANSSGTFSGRSPDPAKPLSSHAMISFTGTWTCGGLIHSWTDFVSEVNRPTDG